MRRIQTDILVIGGGATGTGVLRDLAMRGFKCILLERRDLAYGTTGRFHGLLHSGGRYVVKDPQAARECYEENQILRRIMPQCIEDTGGYFVQTSDDDPAYFHQFLDGCQVAGIPTQSVPIHKMLKAEPYLDPKIQQCIQVPDASADSFLAAKLNVDSACLFGAQVLTYHEVNKLLVINRSSNGNPAVVGAITHDLIKDEDVQIDASMVVNATGAWAYKIAQTAGINIEMVPGKGTMLALNHRVVNTVINRCKPPSDGDILVPAHTVAVMGTTDIKISDPDHYSIEPWEIRMLLDEGEKIIPHFKQFRILRVWAGVRPLVKTESSTRDRDISRAFVLLDHTEHDRVDGMVTISSGKWTTYRKMAQVTADKICEKLKVDRPCRTHLESLPSQQNKSTTHHYLGGRLENIESASAYGSLICECELVTEQDVEQAIVQSNAVTLDDIRRSTRLGMGPCQGAFCSFRATGMLHSLRHPPVSQTNVSLRDFLQERWKGNLPILRGQQLQQARFNELIYIDALNVTNLPGEWASKLISPEYDIPAEENISISPNFTSPLTRPDLSPRGHPQDGIVIGAGLSGLITAWRASTKGSKISLLTRGWGSTFWNTGCIDVYGYQPPDYQKQVESPLEFLDKMIKSAPDHPYAFAGLPAIENAIQSFLTLCREHNYPYLGSLDRNILLPTALGTLRPSCLIPQTMIAGDAADHSPMLIVGFNQFHDFYPGLIAENLNAQGLLAHELMLDFPGLHKRQFITGMTLARLFDDPDFRQEIIAALKPRLGNAGRIGFPAVLGMQNPIAVLDHLQSSLGLPVFEISGLPPSIPGVRLHNLLKSAIERNHGSIQNGMLVNQVTYDDQIVHTVWSEAASRIQPHHAKSFVLATGGILGGGIFADNNGYAYETIFGLPINTPHYPSQWFNREFLGAAGHPINRIGIGVDSAFQPMDSSNRVIFQNLFAVGGTLGNCDPIRERSLEGIALVTGYKVGESIAGSVYE